MLKFSAVFWLHVYKYFSGLGYAMVIVSWLIGLYYNVVISHVLYFLYASFTTELPWASCGNDWNTINCRDANAKTVANSKFSISCVWVLNIDGLIPRNQPFLHVLFSKTTGYIIMLFASLGWILKSIKISACEKIYIK